MAHSFLQCSEQIISELPSKLQASVLFSFQIGHITKVFKLCTNERVAAAKVMIEKIKRLISGNRGEPEG